MNVFENPVSEKVVRKAKRKVRGYRKRFGDDGESDCPLKVSPHPQLGRFFDLWDIEIPKVSESTKGDQSADGDLAFEQQLDAKKSVIVGNIRMGFGHYRIAIAMASAANALGVRSYWFDLHRYQQTTGGKLIAHLNGLYAMGSRWSQQNKLFNKLYWEPLNSEGFRRLSYHVEDWHMTQLMTPIFKHLPKEIPFIGTHVWPAQAAIHAGMKQVVNAIPDNWPMALHLAEGSLHTVQTPSSYWGYRRLNGMQGKEILNPMPASAIAMTGHYVDAELLNHLAMDNQQRRNRLKTGEPLRLLLTVGGAGAQFQLFKVLIELLLPYVSEKRVLLLINVGDHLKIWEQLNDAIPNLATMSQCHFDQWEDSQTWITRLGESANPHVEGSNPPGEGPSPSGQGPNSTEGVHAFYHKDIFAAVYSTNLIMRHVDLLLTKPSELAFYPIPKLMLPRVGGHEAWGAVRAAELGDGTPECETQGAALRQLKTLLEEPEALLAMIDAIDAQDQIGTYDGAYKVVQHAMGLPVTGRPRE
jgi:UDP-N-acetylglucosamine:LPS N-acetylglucosamine transferase